MNNTKNNYAITDWQQLPRAIYYRLQLIDIDGRVNYSNVIVVNNNEIFTIKPAAQEIKFALFFLIM